MIGEPMPIYDYHCDHCGHAFSAVQRFADDAISVCPGCGKPPRRLLSNPALVFKGSGWYKTDSRGPEKKDGGGKGTGKGDADPAGKTEQAEKSGKPEKSEKSEKGDRTEKAASSDKAPAAKAGDAAPAPATKPEKATPASS